MRNIALHLAYDGTNYHGWQSQKNAEAIQDILSDAIFRLTGAKPYPSLEGCGRTDAGVHALDYVANFHTESTIPADRYPFALGQYLPNDIAVTSSVCAADSFHSRFSCIKKEYIYRLYTAKTPNPFLLNRAYFTPHELDLAAMKAAARHIIGKHDFSCFRASGSVTNGSVRTVFDCGVSEQDGIYTVNVCADGFLYNMVRIISGTLYYVGIGKLGQDDIPEIILSGDRIRAGITLPPHGLYLRTIEYPENSFIAGCEGTKE